MQIVVLNAPALVFLVLALVPLASEPSPAQFRRALQQHFDQPLPSSVQVYGYRMSRGMDSGRYEFAFSIGASELSQFLSNSGWALVNSNGDTADWIAADLTMKRLTKGATTLEPPWSIYVFQTNHNVTRWTKTIVVGSNYTDAVFIGSFR